MPTTRRTADTIAGFLIFPALTMLYCGSIAVLSMASTLDMLTAFIGGDR